MFNEYAYFYDVPSRVVLCQDVVIVGVVVVAFLGVKMEHFFTAVK